MKIRRLPGNDDSRDGYLRVGDTEPITQEDLSNLRKGKLQGWGVWVNYVLKSKNDVFSDEDRKLYVFFCVGFLIYYDHILRNTCEEHEIYFDWNPKDSDKAKTIELDIYINPAPRSIASKEGIYPKMPKLNPQKDLFPSYGFTTDPPQPPPPPPPIM